MVENSGGSPIDPRKLVERFGGRKIEAIKYVREETGLGLKEAKELVEEAFAQEALAREALTPARDGGARPRPGEPGNGPEIIDKPRRWTAVVIGLAIIVIGLATVVFYMLSFAA